MYHDFPIPSIPAPPLLESIPQFPASDPTTPPRKHPAPGSPLSQSVDKENSPPSSPPTAARPFGSLSTSPVAPQLLQPPEGTLPPALLASLTFIKCTLVSAFAKDAPYTIQRFSELILRPKQHYRFLHSYLNALERVISVVSGASFFPLPAVGGSSSAFVTMNGNGAQTLGSDEGLGGALLTPIPWLRNDSEDDNGRSPKRIRLSVSSADEADTEVGGSVRSVEEVLRQEGGVTQGELLRQAQENSNPPAPVASAQSNYQVAEVAGWTEDEGQTKRSERVEAEHEEQTHAGPGAIGLEDTGVQEHELGSGQVLNMEAAVGRAGHTFTPHSNRAPATEPAMAVTQQPAVEGTGIHYQEDGDVLITDADGVMEDQSQGSSTEVVQTGADAADTTS